MTAHGGVSGAVEAMRLGAADYLVKPFETEELPLVLERARRSRQSARVVEHRRSGRATEEFFFGETLKPLAEKLEKILAADARLDGPLPPVLIQGETGTGKTALARWLHERGPRAAGELVEVNCSALPETLAESELFGHERGAFTDARATRMGLFEGRRVARCFSMNCRACRWRCKPRCSRQLKTGKSAASAATSSFRWTRASSRQPSAI